MPTISSHPLSKIRFSLFGLTLCLLSLSLLTGCTSQKNTTPIIFGQVVDREIGQGPLNAVKLAVKEYNQTENKPDRPMKVIQVTTGSSRAIFAGEAVRLTKINRVSSLIGGFNLEQTSGLEQDWVPVLSPSGLRSPTMSAHMFLTGLNSDFQGKVLAGFAAKRCCDKNEITEINRTVASLTIHMSPFPTWMSTFSIPVNKSTRVLVLVDTQRTEYSAVADAFAREYREQIAKSNSILSEVDVWKYDNSVQLVEFANQLEDEKPDVLVIAGEVSAVAKVRLRFAVPHVPILYAGLDGTQIRLLNRQETRNNIYWATAWTIDAKTTENRQFVQQYRKAFQQDPDVYAALEYDNTRILLHAFAKNGEHLTMTNMRKSLKNLKDFPILTGKTAFSEKGILTRSAYIVALENGQTKTLSHHNP